MGIHSNKSSYSLFPGNYNKPTLASPTAYTTGQAFRSGNDPSQAFRIGNDPTQLAPVPEASEIRMMLKGKTTAQRRTLLAQIEQQRQSQIHLTYMLEKQKMKEDERWAHRNI